MNFLDLFKNKILLGAHRGASSIAPENTLLALQKSVGKCDFIEIDVTLSRDKVAVILHDDTLERTTNVKELEAFKKRQPFNINDFTYEELKLLDYGEGQKVLSLREALEFIKENSLYLNVEIKNVKKTFEDETIVSTVLKEIDSVNIHERVIVSSFVGEYLLLLKKKSPDMPTALLIEEALPVNLIHLLKGLNVDACHLDKELVTEECVMRLREAGFYVGVYVVNDEKEWENFARIGVNSIFTDTLLY